MEVDSESLTVLLVEDNPADARLLREYLRDAGDQAFKLEHVTRLSAAIERLERGGVNLVLLDLTLPDSAIDETFTRAHLAAPSVPIIVLSGLDDEDRAIRTVQRGAQDYLVKDHMALHPRFLIKAMRYAVERTRIREALAHERDLFHTLLDSLPDRIYFKDRESRFMRINWSVARQFKLDHPRDAVGRTDQEFFAPDHAAIALADETTVMDTGLPILGKIEQEQLPDGTKTWAITSKFPLRDKFGQVIGTFGISRDITPLKQAEEKLAAERNLLRAIIDNLPDYIYFKDSEGRYLLDNVAHQRLIGATRLEDVVNRTVFDFFPQELASIYQADDDEVLHSGKPLINRVEIVVDHAGSRRWHFTTKVRVIGPEDTVLGLVGISRDITEERAAKEELEKKNTELAELLAALQRSHADLKKAQFELIEAEKMQSVGRLAAGVAHEVKNPLAVLRMGIDYLVHKIGVSEPAYSQLLVDMKDAIQRADATIRGLLDYAAPHRLDRKPADLNGFIEQALGMVRHEMKGTKIRVSEVLAPDLPSVSLDEHKIKQALVNLFTNAIHAMGDRGTLTVRSFAKVLRDEDVIRAIEGRLPERFRSGDPVAVVEIEDTGTGIDPAHLARIFDPFFTTKEPGQGTGLGLTVTKRIIELHDGHLSLTNRPEGGAKAVLVFPVGTDEPEIPPMVENSPEI